MFIGTIWTYELPSQRSIVALGGEVQHNCRLSIYDWSEIKCSPDVAVIVRGLIRVQVKAETAVLALLQMSQIISDGVPAELKFTKELTAP